MHTLLKNLLTAICIMAIFPLNLWGGDSEPDFDYPKTVAENASKDLKAALKTSDGQKAIDAIIRYSIAQGLISDENMPDIIKKIEKALGIKLTETVQSGVSVGGGNNSNKMTLGNFIKKE